MPVPCQFPPPSHLLVVGNRPPPAAVAERIGRYRAAVECSLNDLPLTKPDREFALWWRRMELCGLFDLSGAIILLICVVFSFSDKLKGTLLRLA
ncbi:MAG: hypothetical protein JWR05_2467 [Mucilaginibacter sp.]|nr:hypothetical protein [Mucilaginibacter sp.]